MDRQHALLREYIRRRVPSLVGSERERRWLSQWITPCLCAPSSPDFRGWRAVTARVHPSTSATWVPERGRAISGLRVSTLTTSRAAPAFERRGPIDGRRLFHAAIQTSTLPSTDAAWTARPRARPTATDTVKLVIGIHGTRRPLDRLKRSTAATGDRSLSDLETSVWSPRASTNSSDDYAGGAQCG